ncbi:hypothetical protein O181_057145 [Austropuccinia psidii MF-1]|uniref:Uncharacterized protein n=1 Tax=Austropuccinia psidii MF-1 TaxID=1389203 RepID=A0A9Q3EE21_9BASI|nr:hypothetical protein [Austropuccinia psidii MF-1]
MPLLPPSYLLTLLHPHLIFSAPYNPYAPAAPSRYPSDAGNSSAFPPPYALPSPPLTILTLTYPSDTGTSSSRPALSSLPLTILTLPY